MDNGLMELHDRLLDMQIEIAKFCLSNNIQWFLIGGSLLGAVRHDGFIPWDDDLDIGMTRSNYEKFVRLFPKSELNTRGYFIKVPGEYANYHATFLKVCDPFTLLEENTGQKINLFIDIFPFDSVPNNRFSRRMQYYSYLFWFEAVKFRMNDIKYTGLKNAIRVFITLFTNGYSLKQLILKRDSYMKKYNKKKDASTVVNFSSSYGFMKEKFNRAELNSLILHKFESTQFFIPEQFDKFLANMYGNYMALPTKEEQTPKHIINIISVKDPNSVEKVRS